MLDKTGGQESGKLEVSRTIIQRVYNEKVSILTENALKDERFNGSKSVRDYNIRSAVCAPLLSQDEGLGVVYLDNRTESGSFSEADLMFLTALCLQAGIALSNAQLHRQVVEENARLMRDMTPRVKIVGESECMKSVLNIMKKVAPSDITVLIEGETGTGKELIARGIHALSPRSPEPFVAVNCAAIPNELIESELFGHEKGAFTGAASTQPGKFQLAHGGTIFLDEIGDMSLNTQAKVLRALEEKEFRRVGGTKTIKIDVRVLTATNKDLTEAVSRGEFREDLLYRLNAVTIPLPPLRQRRKDIILLAEYFIRGQGKVLSDEAKTVLMSYDWPGNIRELRNCLDRAMVMGGGKVIQPEDLPAGIRKGKQAVGWPLESLEQMEADHITRVLRSVNWRKTDAAKVLGVTRQTLDNKIAKYKIKKP
jgi:transcriptional regulator with GAF, ATPase, and Fis domain